jgi:ACT domain-containing protein
MAEPTQELMLSILQQLQADTTEIKGELRELDTRVAGMERELITIHDEVTYALGSMVALGRNMKTAQARVDEIADRLEKLETK